MAQKSREDIKEFFQTGDIPTQQQYVDLIDSYTALTHDHNSGSLTLSGSLEVTGSSTVTGSLNILGNMLVNDLEATTIATTGDISSSADIVVRQITSSDVILASGSGTNAIYVGGSGSHITASGNISASNVITGNVTASIISASGNISGLDIYALGSITGSEISSSATITAEHFYSSDDIVAASNISSSGIIYTNRLNQGNSVDGLTLTGNISASGEISSSTNILASIYKTDGYTALNTVGTQGRVFGDGDIESIQIGRDGTSNKNIELLGPITASTTISASGFIEGRFRRPMYNVESDGAININHEGAYLRCGPHEITMSLNSAVAFPIGTEIDLIQTSSAGHLRITASAGESVTLNSRFNLYSASGQFSAISLKKVGTNEWDMLGDLTF